MSSSVLVSRSDRLGDLVLSLPALAYVKRHLAEEGRVTLHVSEYAKDLARLAQYNNLCDDFVCGFEAAEAPQSSYSWALALKHDPRLRVCWKRWGVKESLGPRSKLSALWTYSASLKQKRSRVEKSEMEYNVDLAAELLRRMGVTPQRFQGLAPLKVPQEWRTPLSTGASVLMVLSNGKSASNWPVERYIALAEQYLAQERSVDFLVAGHDGAQRMKALKESGLLQREGVRCIEHFDRLTQLIAHIKACSYVVSSSTGPLHIAHALGKPVLALFPSTPKVQSFERWRPAGYWHDAPVEWRHID